jgi:hypothetical protein
VISTAVGLPPGWISSTWRLSPLGVILPAANSMRDDVVTVTSGVIEASASGASANRGRLMGRKGRFRKPHAKVRVAQYLQSDAAV